MVRPRLSHGVAERGRTILGEPGLGKSSLVRRIAQEAADSGDWVTPQLRIPLGADPLKPTAAALLDLADRAGLSSSNEKRLEKMMARVRSVSVHGLSLSLGPGEGPEPYAALTQLLVEVGIAAIAQDKVALVHVDEVQNITDEAALSQLMVALGDAITYEHTVEVPGGLLVRRRLPLAVYLTGLSDFEDRAGAKKGATFVRRFKTSILGPLGDDDIQAALRPFVLEGWEVNDARGGMARVRMEQAAAEAIVDLSKGEPFIFQLAGEGAWNASQDATITRQDVLAGWEEASYEATRHVERVLERLPQTERAFVYAMAKLAPQERTLTRICKEMGYDSGAEVGTIAQRLDRVRGVVNRGRPYSFRHRAIEAYLTTGWPQSA